MFQRNEVSSSSVLDPEDEDAMILQNVMKYLTTQYHIPEDLTLDAKNYPAANTIRCSMEKTCFMDKHEVLVFSSCTVLP